jgi:glycosyltransferase involved in cell wall biosynthesis
MHDSHDLISVVIATYNRSNVLRYSIETVLMQTYSNWELIVVGDCCTDDTEEVVNGFRNEKIRFINLEKNIGEQSGPNNQGVSIAKGKYIAFLNHDDLWFPNHLELLYKKLNAGNYDLVYSHHFTAPVNGILIPVRLRANDIHDNTYFSPASTWLFKKELHIELGPWKFYKKINNVPSQEWLLRVSKTKRIGIANEVTIIAIQSATRKNSYKNRDFKENEFYFQRIKTSPYMLLKEIYYDQFLFLKKRDSKNLYHIMAIIRNLIFDTLDFFGLTFDQVIIFLKNPRKGSFINNLRKIRGLPKI